MTDNYNSEAAWAYHKATKHSYASIRTNPHFLDWANQPLPFKIYATLEPMPLPGEVRQSGVAARSAIAENIPAETNAVPDLKAVAQLLYLSAGITRHRKYPGGEIYFRAAACTGALETPNAASNAGFHRSVWSTSPTDAGGTTAVLLPSFYP